MFLSIVYDTWRQSKQQVVFILLLIFTLLASITFVTLPKIFESEDGQAKFGFLWSEGPLEKSDDFLTHMWEEAYLESSLKAEGLHKDFLHHDYESQEEFLETQKKIEALSQRVEKEIQAYSPLQKSLEFWFVIATGVIFTLSMWGYIAASAGYFPGFLKEGAIDVVLSKPIERWKVFFGKYLGGLVLFSSMMVIAYLILFFGLGFRTGIWHTRIFLSLPLVLFTAALLYAFIAWFGIRFRSTGLAILFGYIFYILIDTGLAALLRLQQGGRLEEITWLDQATETTRVIFPNFTLLKDHSVASIINTPQAEWGTFVTALVWLILMLGLSLRRFQTSDY